MLEVYREAVHHHPESESAFERLRTRYDANKHPYHNWEHIEQVVKRILPHTQEKSLLLAAFYHDVVYVPGDPANEAHSARYADEELNSLAVDEPTRNRVKRAIMATRHTAPVSDPGIQLLMDADILTLAVEPEEYDRVGANIREEYRDIPQELWHEGRRNFIEIFLSRAKIFQSAAFNGKYEAAARANLLRELKRIQEATGLE